MPKHTHKHRSHPKEEPSKISIFMHNEIHAAPQKEADQTVTVNNESKEDGCVGCFKALFKSFKR
jgi:hypothetical protein